MSCGDDDKEAQLSYGDDKDEQLSYGDDKDDERATVLMATAAIEMRLGLVA